MPKCQIPVSARYTIYSDGKRTCEYTYREIDARDFAAFLIRGFGIDADDLSAEPDSENRIAS